MASTTQEELYQSFLTVAGQQTSALGDATALLADAIAQVGGQQSGNLAPVAQQTMAAGDTTALLADVIGQAREQQSSVPAPIPAANQTQTGTQTASSSSGSTSGTVEKTMLEAEAGLPLLIAGLVSAFGGGGSSTPPPLVKYAMPAAVDFQAAESQGQVSGLDYDQMGTPRSYAAAATGGTASGTASGTTSGTTSGGANGSGSGSGAAPQITFNVQAMDARSFMDRSSDIAAAVRDAMLNLNSINDVVNDL
jgi:hypothetical protein